MSKIGELIKEKRTEKNMTQKELGTAANLSDSAIQRYESDKTKSISWEHLCNIANVLDCNPLEFLVAAGYVQPKDLQSNHGLYGINELKEDQLSTLQLFINFLRHNPDQKGGL